IVAGMPEDAVLRVRVTGALGQEHFRVLRAAYVRGYVPATMNVKVWVDGEFRGRLRRRNLTGGANVPSLHNRRCESPQLNLGIGFGKPMRLRQLVISRAPDWGSSMALTQTPRGATPLGEYSPARGTYSKDEPRERRKRNRIVLQPLRSRCYSSE